MFVPKLPTFRQASVAIFMLFSPFLKAEDSLYDELNFLEEASKKVELYLPGEKKSAPTKNLAQQFTDSISTGQAGLLKKPVKTDSYNAKPKEIKRLRFRSR